MTNRLVTSFEKMSADSQDRAESLESADTHGVTSRDLDDAPLTDTELSKNSTKIFQIDEVKRFTEADREWLMEEIENLILEHNTESVKSAELNKLLYENLKKSQVALYRESPEESHKAASKYQQLLDDYKKKSDQKEALKAEIDQKMAEANANRARIQAEMEQAKSGELSHFKQLI